MSNGDGGVFKEYDAARAAELKKVETDAKSERGLGSSLSNCVAVTEGGMTEPADGTFLTPEGDEDAAAAAASSSKLETHRGKLVGMKKLERHAPESFDTNGSPFTLRDLAASKATPDVSEFATAPTASQVTKEAAATAEEEEEVDFGQCTDSDWFFVAGGVDWFMNAMTASRAKVAKFASECGTARNPSDAPTAAAPGASVY